MCEQTVSYPQKRKEKKNISNFQRFFFSYMSLKVVKDYVIKPEISLNRTTMNSVITRKLARIYLGRKVDCQQPAPLLVPPQEPLHLNIFNYTISENSSIEILWYLCPR